MAKEIKKEELKKEEETKELEKENLEEQEPEEGKDLPAEVEGEKKGFHPIKFVTGKVTEFGEKHPKVVSGVKTAGKVAAGVAIGAVGTVAVLASIAKNQDTESNDDNYSSDDEDNIVDSEATEVEDNNSEE